MLPPSTLRPEVLLSATFTFHKKSLPTFREFIYEMVRDFLELGGLNGELTLQLLDFLLEGLWDIAT